MTTQEILNSGLNKTQKGYKLYALGHTRTEVAEWLTNGNYGFAHNIWKKWSDNQTPAILNLPFEYNFNRSFGIEVEIYGASREDLIREITRAGVEIEGQSYNHNTTTKWKIVSDSSISGVNGNEIVSPVLSGLDGIEQIKKVCIGLNRAGAKNNHEYMLGYAHRTVITQNQDIKATDETSFVEDLIKHNHIELLENNLN